MNLKVEFFEGKISEAIGAGIYGIYAKTNGKEKLLYIGESVFVLVRCATHLYKIAQGNGYLGFTNEMIDSCNTTLIFKLLALESDKSQRKKEEKKLIKDKNPIMQSGISDRVKPIESMINELTNTL